MGKTIHHALFWMVIANAVGLLAAVLLLWPQVGVHLAPFTYGRLLPLHMNFHLYGWVSFPLIGLLFHLYGVSASSKLGRLALILWSVSLVLGGLWWLAGHTSGKLFLDWKGLPRLVFSFAQATLWVVLALGQWRSGQSKWGLSARVLFLLLLLPVPFLMYASAGTELYPPVNPHSGGATGSSLLGSTLVVIVLFLIPPFLLNKPEARSFAYGRLLFLLVVCHGVFFMLVDHGNQSHHEMTQIFALATLLPWVPLLIAYYRGFSWPEGSRVWLLGFGFWGGLLAVTGWLSFLPGVLERWKFTNALVAHAHLAMAGMVSSFLMLLLISLNPRLRFLCHRLPAICWQAACLLHVLILLVLGSWESTSAASFFYADGLAHLAYALRFLAGAVMFLASLYWLIECRSQLKQPMVAT